jgi:hypothetical protein
MSKLTSTTPVNNMPNDYAGGGGGVGQPDPAIKQLDALKSRLDDQIKQLDELSLDLIDDNQQAQVAVVSSDPNDKVVSKKTVEPKSGCGVLAAWLLVLFVLGGFVTSFLGKCPSIIETPKYKRPAHSVNLPIVSPGQPSQEQPNSTSRQKASPQSLSSESVAWQACRDESNIDAALPQAGETWWPVVGTAESLNDSKTHCRPDAFINSSGNVQVASFRDRAIATRFAGELSRDKSHPYYFRVGNPSQY